MSKYYLGLDQGTTGVTAILFDTNWHQISRGYREIRQIYPHAGWVEHDPLDIWNSVCCAVAQALLGAAASPTDILCVGVDHEGESIMLWDKETGLPVYNAIVWQDRRTSEKADILNATHGDFIREHTGLTVDSYFSALKLQWLLQNVPEARALLAQNRLLCGTMDTWLVWKMTGGTVHATDISTGSRTMLMNLRKGCWDDEVLSLLDIPHSILPTILPSNGNFGCCVPALFCGISAPITGVLVDQQAALFGQTCFAPGTVKTTYGTGCFMQMSTGDKIVASDSGLLPMVCWNIDGKTTYGLDGGIYIAGAAIQWLRDGLKIISSAAETEAMAYAAGTNNGVYFVPAFAGLAAPYWDSYARGTLIGITGGTTREQIVRATLEATAYQVSDLLKAMEKDSGTSISAMRCDGGAVANRFLMQFQADILGIPLLIPEITETTALGAAFMAAIGSGFVSSPDELQNHWHLARTYEPKTGNDKRAQLLFQWHRAVERARDWAKEI